MNIKRILATILCSAMILTSGTFSSVAYAGEIGGESEIVYAEDVFPETVTENDVDTSPVIDAEEMAADIDNEEGSDVSEGEIDITVDETDEEITEVIDTTEDTDDTEISNSEELVIEEQQIEEETEEVSDEVSDEMSLQASKDLLDGSCGTLAWIEEPATPEERQERFAALGKTLYVPIGTETIPEEFFKGDNFLEKIDTTYVTDTLRTIEEGAFQNCTKLSVFTASSALETIGDNAFSGCGELKTVALNKVETIGAGAFQNTGVTQITASSCTAVGENAFNGCASLVSISFPTVNGIGASAFSGCNLLENIKLPSSAHVLKNVGDYAFKNTAVKSVGWAGYEFPSDDSEYYMGNGVFSNCKALTYIALPAIETIPASTCSGCSALKTIIINKNFDTITSKIDGAAFSGCSTLTKVSLGEVTNVVTSAFADDVNLVEVKFEFDGADADFKVDIDAFPNLGTPKNLKMYGYIDAVHNYADKKGYTFVSLYDTHKITYKASGEGYSVKLSKTSARLGDVVTVTILTEDTGFLVNSIDVAGVTGQKIDTTLTKNAKKEMVFSFYMPGDEDVKVTVASADMKSIKSNAKLNFFSVDSVYPYPNNYVPDGGEGSYTIESSGKEFWIRFMAGYPCVGDKNWQWTFSSNNSNVVRVNELGLVTSVGRGTATVTATLKNTGVIIEQTFTVGNTNRIVKVEMDPVAPSRGSISYSDTDIPIISVDKDYVSKAAMSFTTYINAIDENEDPIIATPSYWSSVDKKNAVVASSKSFDNSMKITIPKGAVGETMIKAYALNPGESKVNENSVGEEGDDGYTDNLALLIIKVVDFTPRLVNKSFDVDFNSSIGTRLQLFEVYDELGEIDKDTGLDIVEKKVVGKEVTAVTPQKFGLQVFYDALGLYNDGIPEFYVQRKAGFNSIMENEKITYKNMFLHGYFDKGEKAEFFIPLGTINLTNKPLKPKLTLSGKINYFYGTNTEGLEKRSKVTIQQSLKNIKIEAIQLKDATHNRNPYLPEEDLLAANFDIKLDLNDNSKIYVSMNPELEALKKDKSNEIVTSGYIYIYYAGYEEPVKLAITIPTCNTAPSYQLSSSGVTMNFYARQQKASFYLFKKGDSKKTPISLEGMDITFNKSLTTGNIFDGTIATSKYDEEDEYDSVMTIKQDDRYSPVSGKAVIRMHHESWAEGKYVDYTYKVTSVKTKPAAKIYGSATATLNQQVMDGTATVWIYSNQDNVPISGQQDDIDDMKDSIVTTVNKKYKDAAQALLDTFAVETAIEEKTGKQMLRITVTCPDPDVVPKGKYTYMITPKVDYLNGEAGVEVKPIAFAVNITNNKITLAMKSGLVFNRDCAGLEEVKTTYTLKNLPSGSKQRDYTVDISDAEIVAPKNVTKEFLDDVLSAHWFMADEDTNKNTCYFGATLNGLRKKDNPFKYTYTIKGAKLLDSEDNEVSTLADFKVTVQMKEVASKFDVSASGSISTIDYYKPSCIKYTAKPKNFNTNISDINLVEIDDNGNDKAENEFFKLSRDYYDPKVAKSELVIRDDKVAYVSLIQGKEVSKRVVPGKKYKVRLEYTLTARTDWVPTKVVEIVVKQSNSAITLKQDVNRIYAGQGNRTVNIKIKPSSAGVRSKIIDVDFKDGKYDSYYQAFTIERDSSGKATTMWQEVDGYNRPLFIDYTNPSKPLKMYVDTELDPDVKMYELNDGDILHYVDGSTDKVVQYSEDNGEFYVGKMVGNDFERTLILDKYPTIADVKPDYYCTFTIKLANSSALVLNKEHTIKFVTVFEEAGLVRKTEEGEEPEPVKGTAFNVKINILK